MSVTTYRLPAELLAEVDEIARRRGVPRTLVVKEALVAYVAREPGRAETPLEAVDRLVTYAGSGVGDLASRSEEHLRAKLHGRRRPR